jgi:membrane protein DedA with SNARE-associated domain
MNTLIAHAEEMRLASLYLLVFGLMFVEGDVMLIALGILAHLSVVSISMALLVGILGGFSSDYLWYSVGRHAQNKNHRFIRWIEKVTQKPNTHIQAHPLRAVLITKFIYGVPGIHRATLLRLGMNNLTKKKFFLYNGASVVAWVTALFSLGYFASESIELFTHRAKRVELILVGIIILAIGIRKGIRLLKSPTPD